MPTHRTRDRLRTFASIFLALSLVFIGASDAHATEITGTLGTGGSGSSTGGSSSTSTQSMGGTVVGGTPDSSQGSPAQSGGASPSSGATGGSSGNTASQAVAPRSGQQHAASSPYSSYSGTQAVQSDGSLAAAPDSTGGTGGGYDPALDSYLASLQAGSGRVSPSDAIAYNRAVGGSGAIQNVAGAAASDSTSGRAMTVALIGLAVAALAAYAVNAYMAYRKERGL